MMATMNLDAAEFEARRVKLINEIVATRQVLIITKDGVSVARIVPIKDEAPPTGLFGQMKDTGNIIDDIINTSS